ncbi:MAG: FIG00018398: hypothetical regulator, partial [uncultured Chloroflexi bacterium]
GTFPLRRRVGRGATWRGTWRLRRARPTRPPFARPARGLRNRRALPLLPRAGAVRRSLRRLTVARWQRRPGRVVLSGRAGTLLRQPVPARAHRRALAGRHYAAGRCRLHCRLGSACLDGNPFVVWTGM